MPTKLRRWTLPVTSIALALVALTGCADAKPIAPPKPTTEPVFASEEEALAAVTETYQQFQALSFQILAEQGRRPERIESITSTAVADVEKRGYADLAASGSMVSGEPIIRTTHLDYWFRHPDAAGVIAQASVCVDQTTVTISDESGAAITPENAPGLVSWTVQYSPKPSGAGLIVSSKETGSAPCA